MARKVMPKAAMTEVERRIDEFRRRNWSDLNLENLNLTEIPEEVYSLKSVERLWLNRNQLTHIPERLRELPQLKRVSLIGNPIQVIPNGLSMYLDLPSYFRVCEQVDKQNLELVIEPEDPSELVETLLRELPSHAGLGGLHLGPRVLILGNQSSAPSAQIGSMLDRLSELKSVKVLSIQGMQLGSVPEGLRKLTQIRHLHLVSLALTNLPVWLGDLPLLESLSLIDNQLTSLPDSLEHLTQLNTLDLSYCRFPHIPSVVFELASLTHLNLRESLIQEIPPDILKLSRLEELYLEPSQLTTPPPEVAGEGLEAIKEYWRQRQEAGTDYLCEAKLIILGEPGAGKTTLAQKLLNQNYALREQQKSTEGIDVLKYTFPVTLQTRGETPRVLTTQFQVNIWDFGGQEIYHATHQFFLTRRSVYVLLCDDRKEDTDFTFWLELVELLTDGSPLLIVQNEKQDRTRDINLSDLHARFPNLKGALATNLATNRGLPALVQRLRAELQNLPHIGTGLPATWKRVREALERDERDYISQDDFLRLCDEHGFTRREDKLQLSGYLHDLGICLHFQDDPVLKHLVILKPTWGTDAVYRVLDDRTVIQNRGRFTRTELRRIWSEARYADKLDELTRLMMNFKLCYELDAGKTFIAPQLLSSEPPSYPWLEGDGFTIQYHYGFMPKGILTRLIVELNRLIEHERVWRTGVVLTRDGNRAEVTEAYSQRFIQVMAIGPSAVGLFTLVDEALEKLHASFPRLKVERQFPCPCDECLGKPDPYRFEQSKLIKFAKKDKPIQCHESGETVDAKAIIQKFLPAALREDERLDPMMTRYLSPAHRPVSIPQEVFVSYAWTDESTALVDKLGERLKAYDIRLLRDRQDNPYKGSIGEFMRQLGKGKCVVVMISKQYLESAYCMFELVKLAENTDFRDRIFPIVLPGARIFNASDRLDYRIYWENQTNLLREKQKKTSGDNLADSQAELTRYDEYRRLIDSLTTTLGDMNALSLEQHTSSDFEELIKRVRERLAQD